MKIGYAALRRESQVIHAWQKRTRRKGDFAACARRPTLRALDLRELLEKLDQNLHHDTAVETDKLKFKKRFCNPQKRFIVSPRRAEAQA